MGLSRLIALGDKPPQVGTPLLATNEARAHPDHKEIGRRWRERHCPHNAVWFWLAECAASYIAHAIRRGLAGKGSAWPGMRADEPVIGHTVIAGHQMPLQRFMGFPPNVDAIGDIDSMDLLAGQSVGLVREIKPAGEIVRELVNEAQEIISRLSNQH